jgi:tetratricopeptide (TPR) repeat protein
VIRDWRMRGLVAALALALGSAELRADSAELHNTTGLAFFYQGKDNEAFAEFVKALQKDPSFAQPHLNLGRLFERQKRYEEAARQFKDALQLDPQLIAAKEGLERMQTALAALGKPTSGAPTAAVALSAEAQRQQLEAVKALVSQGDSNEARRRLELLLGSTPNDPEILRQLGEMALNRADWLQAVQLFGRLKVVEPGNPDHSWKLASVYLRIDRTNEALREVERAIQLRPTQSEYFQLLGQIHERSGRQSEAYTAYNEAARLNPSNRGALGRATELSNKLGLYYYNAGVFFFQQQAWGKARDNLKKAVEKGNLNPEQSAIAQQYLIIAEFSLAKVSEQIKAIQDERAFVEKGQVQRRILVPEAEGAPNSTPSGSYVDFVGWIVSHKDNAGGSEILATRNFREVENREHRIRDGEDNEGGFRSNARMSEWFLIKTPKPLPNDPRVAPSSRIRVRGKLGTAAFVRNPYNFVYSQRPQPTVSADYLEIVRERRNTQNFEEFDRGDRSIEGEVERRVDRARPRSPVNTPPGLSGPLKIDYLRFNEEQLKNLDSVSSGL